MNLLSFSWCVNVILIFLRYFFCSQFAFIVTAFDLSALWLLIANVSFWIIIFKDFTHDAAIYVCRRDVNSSLNIWRIHFLFCSNDVALSFDLRSLLELMSRFIRSTAVLIAWKHCFAYQRCFLCCFKGSFRFLIYSLNRNILKEASFQFRKTSSYRQWLWSQIDQGRFAKPQTRWTFKNRPGSC